jgi:hypothetical protein
MAEINVNLSQNEVQEGFELLPPGDYHVRITNSIVKSGNKGQYIQWEFSVIGKPNKIWDIMSLNNSISLNRLKTLATVAGHKNPNYIRDTSELHGLECMIHVKVETDATGQYEPKNKVTSFKAIEKQVIKPAIPKQQDQPVQMPWGNRQPVGAMA